MWMTGGSSSHLRGYQILLSGLLWPEERGWILDTGADTIDMKEVKTQGVDLSVWLKL